MRSLWQDQHLHNRGDSRQRQGQTQPSPHLVGQRFHLFTVYFAAHEAFTRNVLGRRGWLDQVRLGLVELARPRRAWIGGLREQALSE